MDTDVVRGLLGLLFACGRLERIRGPIRSRYRAVFEGGEGETEFMEEKRSEFCRYFPSRATVRPYRTSVRESGRRTTVLRLRILSPRLQPLFNLLYPYGQQRITRAALELLGGRAAAWLWAQGARQVEDGFELSRVGATEAEAKLVAGWLSMLSGAEAEPTLLYQKPRLHLQPGQAALLQGLLLPYAPVSRRHLFLPDLQP